MVAVGMPRLERLFAIARAAVRNPTWFGNRVVRRLRGPAAFAHTPAISDVQVAETWARGLAERNPQVRSVWLVGSRGTGNAWPASDYDFVVATDSQVEGKPLMSWSDYGEIEGVAVEAIFVPNGVELAAVSSSAVQLYAR